jgi:glyoxylase-like metal-dependent hydrolase (beta-lactamase superfamily II)
MSMCEIFQLNFGACRANASEELPRAICNCLLIKIGDECILVDAGLGVREIDALFKISRKIPSLQDVPIETELPAVRQLPLLGFDCNAVKHIVLTHLDLDHAGGLKDFPHAWVHLSSEEFLNRRNPRYLQDQFEHEPKWVPHSFSSERWLGLEARDVPLSAEVEIKLIPLPGHTSGHCGVAVRPKGGPARWILHVGDAYYSREELQSDGDWTCLLSANCAEDNGQRLESMEKISHLVDRHAGEVTLISSHDPLETIRGVPECL